MPNSGNGGAKRRSGPLLASPLAPPRQRRQCRLCDKGVAMNVDYIDPNRLAAIVYDDGVAVDALMSTFARELIEAGVKARGIVQLPPEEQGCGPRAPMRLQDVETGEIIPLCQDLGPGTEAAHLDPAALAGASARLRLAAMQPSDIVFFSKFGKQEANGGGFPPRSPLRSARGARR